MSPNERPTPPRRKLPPPPPPAVKYGCTTRSSDNPGRYGLFVNCEPSWRPNVGAITAPETVRSDTLSADRSLDWSADKPRDGLPPSWLLMATSVACDGGITGEPSVASTR